MASTVGGIAFYRVDNPVQLAGTQLEAFLRNGVAGVGFQTIGYYGHPYSCRVRGYYASATLRSAQVILCNALRGTLVTVVDDMGETWTNLRVLDMQIAWDKTAYMGAGYYYFHELEFILMPTATYY